MHPLVGGRLGSAWFGDLLPSGAIPTRQPCSEQFLRPRVPWGATPGPESERNGLAQGRRRRAWHHSLLFINRENDSCCLAQT